MDLNLYPQLSIKVSPRLVAANHILELSSMELQQLVGQELDENPALEKIEQPTCSVCVSIMQGSICPQCLSELGLRRLRDQDAGHCSACWPV